MNNEPVAWMDDFGNVFEMKNQFFHIPLYTHPEKEDEGKVCAMCGAIAYDPVIKQTAKTLTDEEIVRISETCDLNHVLGLIDFARAILRKAQEK